jgi:hypothetical protein
MIASSSAFRATGAKEAAATTLKTPVFLKKSLLLIVGSNGILCKNIQQFFHS